MRTTNLIQSYIMNAPLAKQYNSEKAAKEFDVNKELTNRTFIKPLPSNGKLLKPNIFDTPSEIRKDAIYDSKAFIKAIKGEANDHELGRLNDIGMKIGGLAIAGYLYTKKHTPMTKVFEFIGLGTFFAAMNIWPKLFIQLPAYLIHGVNVRQEYEDSFGRKKMFYQDHQFIPWDLYSDKEINKIGDRLHVPKDIPNRREFIQEKMRKIALQNNTLWMLTAGFATPIMSALMCNALETPVAKYLSKVKEQKAEALMTNFSQEILKYDFTKNEKQLESIIESNLNKPMTKETFDEISKNLTQNVDYMVANGIRKDLKRLIPLGEEYTISEDNIEGIRNAIKEIFGNTPRSGSKEVKLTDEQLAKIIPDKEVIIKTFKDKNLLNNSTKDFSEHSKIIQNLILNNIAVLKSENPDPLFARSLDFKFKKLINSPAINKDSKLFESFKQQKVLQRCIHTDSSR